MHGLMIFWAVLALLAVHLLRPSAGTSRFGGLVAFLLGLVLTAGLVRVSADLAGIGRTTDFDRVVNHAVRVAGEDQAPLILFSGASFSRNAIDDERLTEALRAAGYPHRVINFSLEAASLPERAAHLDQFIQHARQPDIVFIEVAERFDDRPTQFFGNSKFSLRGIEQFDLRTSAFAALGLTEGGCSGLADCVQETGLLGAHLGLNLLNVGLIGQGERPENAGELSAWDAQHEPRVEVEQADRSRGLTAATISNPDYGPRWIASMRSMSASKLDARGTDVAYYFPPVIDPGARAYAAGLCAGELAGEVCIAPDAPDLLEQLDGPFWLDEEHLLEPGAAAYTDWLAAQLIESGLLEGGQP